MISINELETFKKKNNLAINFNFDLKKTNWFNIGGKTKAFFKAKNLNELRIYIKEFGLKEKIFILGNGSNILIDDKKTYDGTFIKLGKNFSNISILPNNVIVAGSAATDKKLSNFAQENNIGGLEFLSCIPGTVGGGLKMNSGCFDREFKDILISIQALDRKGNLITIPSSKLNFEYRKNNLDKNLIFLSASFKGTFKDKEKIKDGVEKMIILKEKTQPTRIKTGGSTFKNPVSQTKKKVWELINQSVPKDLKFGDAKISEKHCNFFINTKNSSFDDMKNLIEYVKEKVKLKTGIDLETEIEIIS
tara:strand:- start:17201 stop:18115 length:915 start_codon:yes stop_codon:yes gene_type:complete